VRDVHGGRGGGDVALEGFADEGGELGFANPVVWFVVVGAELDDDHVGREGEGLREHVLLDVGFVALLEQGRAAASEDVDDVGFSPEHALELGGVGVAFRAGGPRAEGYAITEAGDAHGGGRRDLGALRGL
jgi:hypothetical protein